MADTPERERKMGLARIEVGGRFFTKYDPNIALDIVERIAEGELLRNITKKGGTDGQAETITKQTFLRWVSTVPELSSAYSAALQISAHAFEELAIEKAQSTALLPGTPQNVSAASLLISQYRWSAARRNPTRYSDKGNTQIVVPININTTLDLGNKSQTRDVEVPDIYTISIPAKQITEGEFSEVTDEPANVLDGSESGGTEKGSGEEVTPLDTTLSQAKLAATKEQFRELLRPDEPVVGTQRQPIIRRSGKGGSPPGPRKRVLTPRQPKDKH